MTLTTNEPDERALGEWEEILNLLGAHYPRTRPANGQGWMAVLPPPDPVREVRLEPAFAEGLPDGLHLYRPLVERLSRGLGVTPELSSLVDEAVAVWARPGFDTFVSLPRLRFEPFGYQLRAAERALRQMHGRAVLADEVGLGKTIEAALVASELRLRGLAQRVLVIVPAGLVAQWREELDRKFALPSVVAGQSEVGAEGEDPIVLASLHAARRDPLRHELTAREWDLVVADEAHHLRNPRSASSRLVRGLRTRYLLLLTATPVENRLDDLFHLMNLVRPGHLGTRAEFRSRFASVDGIRNLSDLQALTREVMVRHRRSEVALALPRRLASTHRVQPEPAEAELYRLVSERVRAEGAGATPARALALRSVQQLAGSGQRALAGGLRRAGWHDLAEGASGLSPTAKTHALIATLQRFAPQKVIVFCAYRDTLDELMALARAEGVNAVAYHGSLTRRAKDEAIRAFEDHAQVLLTTEAAGEGRNLQFCHVMVNFDLPWNPMRIEQRLGRIHRIGQRRDVEVVNLVARGTIEDRILGVLEKKINLFELVVGELDMILGHVDDDFDFERAVFDAHLASRDDLELCGKLERLGDDLTRARRAYLRGRERTDELVGDSET
jgi:SNF2 family DNA or RNA helicase